LWQEIALLQSIVGYIPLADTVKAKEFRVMWIALNHHYFYGEVKLLLETSEIFIGEHVTFAPSP